MHSSNVWRGPSTTYGAPVTVTRPVCFGPRLNSFRPPQLFAVPADTCAEPNKELPMYSDAISAIASNTSFAVAWLVIAGWVWVYVQTGSSHPLSMRLWRVLTGTQTVGNPEIRIHRGAG